MLLVESTQNGHLVGYHSETLFDDIHRYPTYVKEIYSIVQAYIHWNNYILWKDTIMEFMQMQAKLYNDHHQKCSTYLQQLHLNIMYTKGRTNHIVKCLS